MYEKQQQQQQLLKGVRLAQVDTQILCNAFSKNALFFRVRKKEWIKGTDSVTLLWLVTSSVLITLLDQALVI